MKNINICIAGLGNVGSVLVKLIEKNAKFVKHKSDLSINIIGLSAKNKDKKREFDVNNFLSPNGTLKTMSELYAWSFLSVDMSRWS